MYCLTNCCPITKNKEINESEKFYLKNNDLTLAKRDMTDLLWH